MNFLSLFVLVYHLIIGFSKVDSQVNSTGNSEDIKAIIKEILPEELVDNLTKKVFDLLLNNTQDARRYNKYIINKPIDTRQFIIVNEKKVDFETLVNMVKQKLMSRRNQVPKYITPRLVLHVGDSQRKIIKKHKATLSNIKDISFEATKRPKTKRTKNNSKRYTLTTSQKKSRFEHKSILRHKPNSEIFSKSKEDAEGWLINRSRFKIVTRSNKFKNIYKKVSADTDDEERKVSKSVSKIRDLLKAMSKENKERGKKIETTYRDSSEIFYSDESTISTISSSEIKAETRNLGDGSADVSMKITEKLRKVWFKPPTPDYIKKTTVAIEKYNFDEQIPENDRIRSSESIVYE
ncbi:uncharacterized protein LOC121736861 [Aricia agestis]|uniref:uncharacterized protein LOC121736861 n=1 Tax=Aricia agestis TaxID=91739 RepID=UPI001C204AAA|nr:uncharacterized protein LOC121736861 [Aricia agestis]XP_041984259.1 uncharacterized protein LOC121736861 [Aricia agestis]